MPSRADSRVPRNHHLSECEILWSKKSPYSPESGLEGCKVSDKPVEEAIASILHPCDAYDNVPFENQRSSCRRASIEKIHQANASATMSNYVMFADNLQTVDIGPVRCIAFDNLKRIGNVLKKAEKTNCRLSNDYPTNRIRESAESSRSSSPETSKSKFSFKIQPGPDGIVIGGKYNWLRPSTACTHEERKKYVTEKHKRSQLQNEMKIDHSLDCHEMISDPWPYYYRMSLSPPISKKVNHECDWDKSSFLGIPSSTQSTAQQTVQPESKLPFSMKLLHEKMSKRPSPQIKSLKGNTARISEFNVPVKAKILNSTHEDRNNNNNNNNVSNNNNDKNNLKNDNNYDDCNDNNNNDNDDNSNDNNMYNCKKNQEICFGNRMFSRNIYNTNCANKSPDASDIPINEEQEQSGILFFQNHAGPSSMKNITNSLNVAAMCKSNENTINSKIKLGNGDSDKNSDITTSSTSILLQHDVQILWKASLLNLKECSLSLEKNDIDLICSSEKEEKVGKQEKIEFAVGYLCVLLDVEPIWNLAKFKILKASTPLLCFLREVQPGEVPIRNLKNAILFKSEKMRILDLDLEFLMNSNLPVEKLLRWIFLFDLSAINFLSFVNINGKFSCLHDRIRMREKNKTEFENKSEVKNDIIFRREKENEEILEEEEEEEHALISTLENGKKEFDGMDDRKINRTDKYDESEVENVSNSNVNHLEKTKENIKNNLNMKFKNDNKDKYNLIYFEEKNEKNDKIEFEENVLNFSENSNFEFFHNFTEGKTNKLKNSNKCKNNNKIIHNNNQINFNINSNLESNLNLKESQKIFQTSTLLDFHSNLEENNKIKLTNMINKKNNNNNNSNKTNYCYNNNDNKDDNESYFENFSFIQKFENLNFSSRQNEATSNNLKFKNPRIRNIHSAGNSRKGRTYSIYPPSKYSEKNEESDTRYLDKYSGFNAAARFEMKSATYPSRTSTSSTMLPVNREMRTGAVSAADDIDFYRRPSIYNSVLRLKRITEEEKREEKIMKKLRENQNQNQRQDNRRERGSEKVNFKEENKNSSQTIFLQNENNFNENKSSIFEIFYNFVWCGDQSTNLET